MNTSQLKKKRKKKCKYWNFPASLNPKLLVLIQKILAFLQILKMVKMFLYFKGFLRLMELIKS